MPRFSAPLMAATTSARLPLLVSSWTVVPSALVMLSGPVATGSVKA